MKQHLPMITLSDREKELIKLFLHDAYIEGGRGLWLIAKKYVTVSYWFHMLTYEGRSSDYTVWNMINKVRIDRGEDVSKCIEEGLKCEMACVYPWEKVDDDDPLWEGHYRNFKIRTLLDKNPTSMKQFYLEFNKFLQEAYEEIQLLKRLNLNVPPPAIDTPFSIEMPF